MRSHEDWDSMKICPIGYNGIQLSETVSTNEKKTRNSTNEKNQSLVNFGQVLFDR